MTNFLLMGDAAGPSLPFSLPTGTVTFLLTDIEASTQGWESDADAMGPAVARHYELIDAAVVRWGGVRPVEQGEGDSTVSAFSRASDAVAAALDAQRSFAAGLNGQFRVRMALHTGEAQLRDEGNYFGQAVIRCARLRSCGHGGQVLLSHTTADLVIDRLPDGAILHDLGPHRLKDLARPEQVFELGHPDLAESGHFPLLESLDAFPHNLPSQLTPLVGREQEIHDVVALVHAERLTTLTGTGGAGKTRLAAEVGARLVSEFAGGVWWCELAPRRDVDAVAALLADALRVGENAGRPLLDQVVERLRSEGPALIILDNAEHLIDAIARVSAELLAAVPQVRLLVTSREPLSVSGELAWRVPSLAVPPDDAPPDVQRLEEYAAVALFVDRAVRARPGFALDDRNAAAVARICQRLDGIPLAIELAAARTRSLSPDRIASQLDDRFRLLTGGPRTLLPRQQTLLASVAWSDTLLDEPERAALHRLGVFVGGFTLEAAESVLGSFSDTDPYAVLDLVSRLVDKSLVVHDQASGRYRLLETIRTFALSRLLDEGEIDEAREAHLMWALQVAEAYATISLADVTGRIAAYPDLAAEWSNLAAALDWSVDRPDERMRLVGALGPFWLAGQRISDALEYALPSIERYANDPPRSWYRAVGLTAPVLGNAGVDGAAYDALLARARDLAAEAADQRTVLELDLSSVIRTAKLSGLTDEFIDDMRNLLRQAEDHGDGITRFNTAMIPFQWLTMAGRFSEAESWTHALPRVSRIIYIEAFGAILRGRFAEAAALLSECIDLAQLSQMHTDLFLAESGADMLEWLTAGEVLLATRHGVLPLAPAQAFSSNDQLAVAARGRRAILEGDEEELLRLAGLATPDTLLDTRVTVLLAAGLAHVGRHDEARARVVGLVDCGRKFRNPCLEAEARLIQADLDESADDAYEALALAQRYGMALLQIDALELVAVAVERDGGHERAGLLKAAALAERERIGYRARWGSREQALSAVSVDAAVEAPSLDKATALALRGRGERRRPTLGWDSLTPTELDVANLVATGLTNPEVAERLHVGRSTVKSHLDHIYTRLSINSRSELAAEVARRERP